MSTLPDHENRRPELSMWGLPKVSGGTPGTDIVRAGVFETYPVSESRVS